MKILFILIKNNPNIKKIEIFQYFYLYTAYADNKIFSLQGKTLIFYVSEKFKLFSDIWRLKPNTTKCQIAEIGVLKGVQAVFFGIICINLTNEAIKILGAYFSYNLKIKNKTNYYNIVSGILNLWRIRTLASSSFNQNPLPCRQRIREDTKCLSLNTICQMKLIFSSYN